MEALTAPCAAFIEPDTAEREDHAKDAVCTGPRATIPAKSCDDMRIESSASNSLISEPALLGINITASLDATLIATKLNRLCDQERAPAAKKESCCQISPYNPIDRSRDNGMRIFERRDCQERWEATPSRKTRQSTEFRNPEKARASNQSLSCKKVCRICHKRRILNSMSKNASLLSSTVHAYIVTNRNMTNRCQEKDQRPDMENDHDSRTTGEWNNEYEKGMRGFCSFDVLAGHCSTRVEADLRWTWEP